MRHFLQKINQQKLFSAKVRISSIVHKQFYQYEVWATLMIFCPILQTRLCLENANLRVVEDGKIHVLDSIQYMKKWQTIPSGTFLTDPV